ncbi:MAG: DUF5107 domain-containing protein [Lapillicoccus sp.]
MTSLNRSPARGVATLHLSTLTLPTAGIGAQNPLPPLAATADLHAQVEIGPGVDEEMRRRLGYGHVASIAPYLLQDDYGRDRVPVEHPVAVLENEHLRATFLVGSGGRLWSLWHKASGRELLYSNAVFQPGNLALRDAWFAGGVEWNIGTTGHTPLTASPLHVARVDLPDGTPVLRMWEYERLREVVYQLDMWLPPGATNLLVSVRISNPNDHEVPTYWWSNIAVPEGEDVRVVAPADGAWRFVYGTSVDHVPMPVLGGVDRSYPTRSTAAADYFFDLEDPARPWVTALDGQGTGLVQTSTRRLQGRKLFVWGTGGGGRHWQQWLSPAGGTYLEIQAGLAHTQLEHLPMPAGATWSWVESYGLLEVDPALVHGDWATARSAVSAAVQAMAPDDWLEAREAEGRAFADVPPTTVLQHGSGWGALERARRRGQLGDDRLELSGTPFGEAALGAAQQPWLELLRTGALPATSPRSAPLSYQTSPAWRALLEAAVEWLGLLHLGVAQWQAGERGAAARSWRASVAAQPSAWAWRNIAVAHRAEGGVTAARAAYDEAVALAPDVLPLVVERLENLGAAGDLQAVRMSVESLPPAQRASPRVRLAELRAAIGRGDLDRATELLDEGLLLPGLREGAVDLEQLWDAYAVARLARSEGGPVDDDLRARARTVFPLPPELDFRMTEAPSPGPRGPSVRPAAS